MKYIGDISKRDAHILAFLASRYPKILEFGSGGSTQVMAQSLVASSVLDGGHITSVETDPKWVERTRKNLSDLGVPSGIVDFVPYEGWLDACPGPYDLIFVDGRDDLRSVFGRTAWHLLSVGGTIVYHDTRRVKDMRICMELAMEHFNEISDIFMNMDGSNLSGFQRKDAEPYKDWNTEEHNEPWMTGAVEPPEGWVELLG